MITANTWAMHKLHYEYKKSEVQPKNEVQDTIQIIYALLDHAIFKNN